MNKENLELAEEHVKIAEEIIEEEGLNAEGNLKEKLTNTALDLEKAEAELDEVND